MSRKPDLDAAYGLRGPDDSRALYADWAESYDTGFAGRMGYRLPQVVALVFAEMSDGRGPVLDAGAGTGLLVQALPVRGMYEIDGLDISGEMLAVAAGKGLYRRLIEADLTGVLPLADGVYGAVVSSGTFTHGHVGPEALDELLRVARKGALFVLAINAGHYGARGFEAKFAALGARVSGLVLREVRIYGDEADAAHRDDTAQIAVFRKG